MSEPMAVVPGSKDLLDGHPDRFPAGSRSLKPGDPPPARLALRVCRRREPGHHSAVPGDGDPLPILGGAQELGEPGLRFAGLNLANRTL